MDKLIITAAICGAEVTKEQNPNVPYTVEEIVREAKSAVDAHKGIRLPHSSKTKAPEGRLPEYRSDGFHPPGRSASRASDPHRYR